MKSCSKGKLLLHYFKFTNSLLPFVALKTPLLSAGIFNSGPGAYSRKYGIYIPAKESVQLI